MPDILTHADFVLPPPQPASVAVHNSKARFPVRRIISVGRNYGCACAGDGARP